jgi:acetyl-CoA carboxylase carboxyl transferase subunit beta
MSWINKILPSKIKTDTEGKSRNIPEGLWKKCPRCDAVLYSSNLAENNDICPKCDHHLRISARRRIDIFLDSEERVELGKDIEPSDILKFKDLKKYKDRLIAANKATGENDALVVMQGKLKGQPVVVVAFEFALLAAQWGRLLAKSSL